MLALVGVIASQDAKSTFESRLRWKWENTIKYFETIDHGS